MASVSTAPPHQQGLNIARGAVKACPRCRPTDADCLQAGLHWSKLLTSRLGPRVKLVGSTISCEPAWQGGNTTGAPRQNPHVQSYVMATDQVAPHSGAPCSSQFTINVEGKVPALELSSCSSVPPQGSACCREPPAA